MLLPVKVRIKVLVMVPMISLPTFMPERKSCRPVKPGLICFISVKEEAIGDIRGDGQAVVEVFGGGDSVGSLSLPRFHKDSLSTAARTILVKGISQVWLNKNHTFYNPPAYGY